MSNTWNILSLPPSSFFAVGYRDFAWTSSYSILYVDNPVSVYSLKKTPALSVEHFPTFESVFIYFFVKGRHRFQLHWWRQGLRSQSGRCWQRSALVNCQAHVPVDALNWCWQLLSPLLFSALTQFFQIFPEYQSNEFYATGEVRFCHFRFSLTCLFVHVNINNPATCSLTRGSTFLPFPTTSTKTTPLPKWRSTLSEWQSVTDSVIQKRFVNGLI